MKLHDFDFHLPPELIAQAPLDARSSSRLLTMDGRGSLSDCTFRELPQFLNPGDVMVFNDTKVIKARLFGKKESGGKIEALVERVLDQHRVLASIRASHSPKPDSVLVFEGGVKARVVERRDGFYVLSFEESVWVLLEAYGHLPLRPIFPMLRASLTRSDTRPSMRRILDQLLPQPPGCTSTIPCWGSPQGNGRHDRLRDAPRRRGHLPAHTGGEHP